MTMYTANDQSILIETNKQNSFFDNETISKNNELALNTTISNE